MDNFKILGTEIDKLNPIPNIDGSEKLVTGRTWFILCYYVSN